MGISKTRNWGFVVYESAPDGWLEMLADTHIPAFISPLHDRDTDENGELKKPHHHIILMFDGPTTQKRANEIIEPFNGTKSAEYIFSLRGATRYLAHLDNPEKAQYDPAEINALSGADLVELLKPNATDRYKIIGDIIKHCREAGIYEFSDLTTYAMLEHDDWLPIMVEKAYFINQFLHSLRHSQRR